MYACTNWATDGANQFRSCVLLDWCSHPVPTGKYVFEQHKNYKPTSYSNVLSIPEMKLSYPFMPFEPNMWCFFFFWNLWYNWVFGDNNNDSQLVSISATFFVKSPKCNIHFDSCCVFARSCVFSILFLKIRFALPRNWISIAITKLSFSMLVLYWPLNT